MRVGCGGGLESESSADSTRDAPGREGAKITHEASEKPNWF